jgi:hypothetical protein
MIYVPEFGSTGQSYLGLLEFTANGAAAHRKIPAVPDAFAARNWRPAVAGPFFSTMFRGGKNALSLA